MYLCISQKVPAEEADVLSKLLAEVAGASVPNVLHVPAAKVSGVSVLKKMCPGVLVIRKCIEYLPCIVCYDPFHRTQVLDWPIFPPIPSLTS